MEKGIIKTSGVKIKMYGQWSEWSSPKEAILALLGYCQRCEGAERERYMDALFKIKKGLRVINTDNA